MVRLAIWPKTVTPKDYVTTVTSLVTFKRIVPVSYTHLDVYKRQLWFRALSGDVAGLVTVKTTLHSAFTSNVTRFTTVVTLLEFNSSWHGTIRLNVTRLVTVVT